MGRNASNDLITLGVIFEKYAKFEIFFKNHE